MEQAKLNKILDEHKEWLRTNGKKGEKSRLALCQLALCRLALCRLGLFRIPSMVWRFIRNVQFSKNTSEAMKKICRIKSLINQANKFHRVSECGEIELVGDK